MCFWLSNTAFSTCARSVNTFCIFGSSMEVVGAVWVPLSNFEFGRLFMKKINVEFYLDVSVFRTAEIWPIRVHWSHPARLGWTRRLQNKIWIQNQQSLIFRVFVFQINFSFLHSFEKVLLEFPESGRFKTHQNDYSPLWFF